MTGDPWIGRTRSWRTPNRMDKRCTVLAEAGCNLVEVFAVMGHADMFEHPNRDDLIIFVGQVAIILYFEVYPIAEPGSLCTLLCETVLLTG